jgi:hypothetical protein
VLAGHAWRAVSVVVAHEKADVVLAGHLERTVVVMAAGEGAHAAPAIGGGAAVILVAVSVVVAKPAETAAAEGVETTELRV